MSVRVWVCVCVFVYENLTYAFMYMGAEQHPYRGDRGLLWATGQFGRVTQGMIQTAWHGMAWHCMARHGTFDPLKSHVQHGTIQVPDSQCNSITPMQFITLMNIDHRFDGHIQSVS